MHCEAVLCELKDRYHHSQMVGQRQEAPGRTILYWSVRYQLNVKDNLVLLGDS